MSILESSLFEPKVCLKWTTKLSSRFLCSLLWSHSSTSSN